jgi:SAM-dependent methyltransferase
MLHDASKSWADHLEHERSFRASDHTVQWYRHILESLPFWEYGNRGNVLEIGAGEFGGFRSLVPADSYRIVDPIWGDAESPWGDLRIRAESLPMPDETFDLVIVSNAIDHCEQPGAVAREIVRVLTAGGSVLCGHYLNQKPHPWSFETVDEMPEMFSTLTVRHKVVLTDRARNALDYTLSRIGIPPHWVDLDIGSDCDFGLVWLDKS